MYLNVGNLNFILLNKFVLLLFVFLSNLFSLPLLDSLVVFFLLRLCFKLNFLCYLVALHPYNRIAIQSTGSNCLHRHLSVFFFKPCNHLYISPLVCIIAGCFFVLFFDFVASTAAVVVVIVVIYAWWWDLTIHIQSTNLPRIKPNMAMAIAMAMYLAGNCCWANCGGEYGFWNGADASFFEFMSLNIFNRNSSSYFIKNKTFNLVVKETFLV